MSIKVKYKNTIKTMNTTKKIELNCNFTKIWKKVKLFFTKKMLYLFPTTTKLFQSYFQNQNIFKFGIKMLMRISNYCH